MVRNTEKRLRNSEKVFRRYGGGELTAPCCACGELIEFPEDSFCLVAVSEEAKTLRAEYSNRRGSIFYQTLITRGLPDGYAIKCDKCVHGKSQSVRYGSQLDKEAAQLIRDIESGAFHHPPVDPYKN